MAPPKGWKHSDESKSRISRTMAGWKPWNTGLKGYKKAYKPRYHTTVQRVPSHLYRELHLWLKYGVGKPDHCEHCKLSEQPQGMKYNYFMWSNKTGVYEKDLKNWWQLCRKCHINYDNLMDKLRYGHGHPKSDRCPLAEAAGSEGTTGANQLPCWLAIGMPSWSGVTA